MRELREDVIRELEPLPDYVRNLLLASCDSSQTLFGWKMRLEKSLPKLSSGDESGSPLFDGIQDRTGKRSLRDVRYTYAWSMTCLKAVFYGSKCRAPHDLKLPQVLKSQRSTRAEDRHSQCRLPLRIHDKEGCNPCMGLRS